RRPFVFSTLCSRAIDAGNAQACGLKMIGAKLLQRVFGGKLYFAVERIGDGFVHFIQPCAGRTRAVDGAAREEGRAADAGPPCRFEEGDAAIQIAAAERGRILPLATTIFARHMVKGCMNKEISALEQAAGKLAAKFIWLEPDRHRKEVSGWLGTAKDNNRMTGSEKTFDDEASHIT